MDEALITDPEVQAPRRGAHRLRIVACVAFVTVGVIGLWIGFAIGDDGPGVGGANLWVELSEQEPEIGQRAVALAAGLTREQDGLTFGEWAKRRAAKECPGYEADDFGFHVLKQEGYASEVAVGAIRWEVYVDLRPGIPVVDRSCVPQGGVIGAVWSDTGVLDPVANRTGNTTSVPMVFDGHWRPARESPPQHGTWLHEFEAGLDP